MRGGSLTAERRPWCARLRSVIQSAPLRRSFYERQTLDVAKDLLGKVLVRNIDGATVTGRIVETEAYRGADDPASHAFRGMTRRNSIMFGHGGLAYVYFVYGRNWCLNATTERTGRPGAVLIRALEPVAGLAQMAARRGVTDILKLTSGPGRLTQALGVTGEQNGTDLTRDEDLYICSLGRTAGVPWVASSRVGVGSGSRLLWRFSAEGSRFVSRR